jgi:hypothetical protein
MSELKCRPHLGRGLKTPSTVIFLVMGFYDSLLNMKVGDRYVSYLAFGVNFSCIGFA